MQTADVRQATRPSRSSVCRRLWVLKLVLVGYVISRTLAQHLMVRHTLEAEGGSSPPTPARSTERMTTRATLSASQGGNATCSSNHLLTASNCPSSSSAYSFGTSLTPGWRRALLSSRLEIVGPTRGRRWTIHARSQIRLECLELHACELGFGGLVGCAYVDRQLPRTSGDSSEPGGLSKRVACRPRQLRAAQSMPQARGK